MKFLVICNHERVILDVESPKEARLQFKCKSCVKFNTKDSTWHYKDVRIYQATERDLKATAGVLQPLPKQKKAIVDQLDWVEIEKCAS